ncbi:hypothetical protein, partial [Tessaracoccus sp. ZS01]|uniref:hypothetical protein n=1 Tax=Tessaracoccus sp. ZS01 TaxID=1906324 RepID=UPI001300CB61
DSPQPVPDAFTDAFTDAVADTFADTFGAALPAAHAARSHAVGICHADHPQPVPCGHPHPAGSPLHRTLTDAGRSGVDQGANSRRAPRAVAGL